MTQRDYLGLRCEIIFHVCFTDMTYSLIFNLRKKNVVKKLADKIAASVLLELFINSNER